MMLYPSMIADAAIEAGILVPPDPDNYNEDDEAYIRFTIYCKVQLGRPISWGEHWENAKVIAAIPETKLKTITLNGLIERGLHYQ